MLSGDTTSTCSGMILRLALQRLGLLEHAVHATDVEERLLRNVVELAVDQLLEALDRLGDGHVDALQPRERLTHEERLREEALNLAGPGHDDAVLFGELVEAEDGDDVLELLVALEHLLDPPGAVVVALTDD